MNNGTPLLDRIAKHQRATNNPSQKVATYRNGQPKPEWVIRAEEKRLVAKEYTA